MPSFPVYFLTWTTYGTWLHGDQRGSVDDQHNARGTPFLKPDSVCQVRREVSLAEKAFLLDVQGRGVVERAIEAHCAHRNWGVHALNVRTNHIHILVEASSHSPEDVMGQLKSWSTRYLRESGIVDTRRRLWTKMGSTRWINEAQGFQAAVDYVLNHQ
ncbi:MAG: transposase [Phycisphaerales bacterium]|nr:transposase [Phycisphaerales bacterium]MCB9835445.1 transposase [Phycisphaera sp.]